jgi:5,5'-dehydrodivanillate O-demethylase
MPEPEGLRCPYHGSLYDRQGRCLVRAGVSVSNSEEADRYSISAYPVQELGGLIFAYLGPEPVPLLPRWVQLVEERVVRAISSTVIPCNWLQCMENALDGRHVSWLHGYYGNYLLERKGRQDEQRPVRSLRTYAWERFEHGLMRIHAGTDDPPARLVFPMMTPGGPGSMLMRVPLDDTHTWGLEYLALRFPPEADVPVQETVPVFSAPITSVDSQGYPDWPDWPEGGVTPLQRVLEWGRPGGQDHAMWLARGTIADRSSEEPDSGDVGAYVFRELLEENVQRIERGEDPIGVMRDPTKNICLQLDDPDIRNVMRRPTVKAEGYEPILAQVRSMAASPTQVPA